MIDQEQKTNAATFEEKTKGMTDAELAYITAYVDGMKMGRLTMAQAAKQDQQSA